MAAVIDAHSFAEAQALLQGLSTEEAIQASDNLNRASKLSRRQSNALDSTLLQLPQELRDHIIRVDMPSSIQLDPYSVMEATETPRLLQVCSQLRLDAAKIYYGTPIYFPWVNPDNYKKWTDSVHEEYRQFVKAVHIDRFFPTTAGALDYAQQCDLIGRFKPGTVSVSTSVGPIGDTTSVWINSLGKTKLYEEVLPLSAAAHSALPDDKYDFISWD